MELGKTLQVIAFLLSEYPLWKEEEGKKLAMIVCPASLVYNWKSEIERFAREMERLGYKIPIFPSISARRNGNKFRESKKIY